MKNENEVRQNIQKQEKCKQKFLSNEKDQRKYSKINQRFDIQFSNHRLKTK